MMKIDEGFEMSDADAADFRRAVEESEGLHLEEEEGDERFYEPPAGVPLASAKIA